MQRILGTDLSGVIQMEKRSYNGNNTGAVPVNNFLSAELSMITMQIVSATKRLLRIIHAYISEDMEKNHKKRGIYEYEQMLHMWQSRCQDPYHWGW